MGSPGERAMYVEELGKSEPLVLGAGEKAGNQCPCRDFREVQSKNPRVRTRS